MALLLIAFGVGLAARRLFVPYSAALLIVGVVLGYTHLLAGIDLTSQTILVVFLPTLLFQGAINLDLKELRAAVLPIALLAIVGVAISMAIIGGLFALAVGVPVVVAIVLAAVLSATDPVAVLAIFRRLGVPKRLEMVLEGESLFNDGTALVAFQIALGAVATSRIDVVNALSQFVLTVVGGLLLGAAAGFVFSHLLALTDDHLFEMGFSTILAYGAYLAGDALHVSPVIAVVTAGIVVGNYGRDVGLSERARVVVLDVWEYLAFIGNSVLFLLMGQQLQKVDYVRQLVPSAIVVGLVLLSRAVVVYGLTPILSRVQRPVPWAWRHLTFWGGLRGALSIAMVLSLPAGFPYRETVVAASFSTVLFTILVQGISMEHVVRWLGVRETESF